LEILPGFGGRRILVLGDLVLDEYLVGRPARISREAPVLVLEYEKRFALPGGGTNPARSLQSLGAQALMGGVVGDDEAGVELRALLETAGILTDGVVVDPTRPTVTKTRILAHDSNIIRQQVVRIDRLSRRPLEGRASEQLVEYLETTVPRVDAVLLSDYKSGVITPETVEVCDRLARRHQKLLTVDSQGDLHRFKGFELVKCNQAEAEATLGASLDSEESFAGGCRRLLEELEARVVVITRGANGMSLMEAGGRHIHIPVANRSEVFDVTGAGDTAIAVITLALAAGARPVVAANLANYAAGLVVRKLGNATTTLEEMQEAIISSQFPRVDPESDFMQ
jgi:rfaE bifunctional protein kinase chain/domain